jgi:hypothetical protein
VQSAGLPKGIGSHEAIDGADEPVAADGLTESLPDIGGTEVQVIIVALQDLAVLVDEQRLGVTQHDVRMRIENLHACLQ